MSRRLCVLCAVMTLVCSGAVIAQRAPQTRPPLFLSEGWKALATPPDEIQPCRRGGAGLIAGQDPLDRVDQTDVSIPTFAGSSSTSPASCGRQLDRAPRSDRGRSGSPTSPTAATDRGYVTVGRIEARRRLDVADPW